MTNEAESGRAERSSSELHITVGSTPAGELRANVSKNLALVKSALLYADRVTLMSPATTMLLSAVAVPGLPMRGRILFVKEVLPLVNTAEDHSAVLSLLDSWLTANRRTRRHLRHVERIVNTTFDAMREKVPDLIHGAGAEDLISAVADGHVQLHSLGFEGETSDPGWFSAAANASDDDLDNMPGRYVAGILESIYDPSTFPLLDDQAQQLIRAGQKAGTLSFTAPQADRGKHFALAGHQFGQIPTLGSAPLNEVIAMCEHLRRPLTRFRKAMLRMSSSIQDAPWGEDFPLEAPRIQREEVEPALLDLQERFEPNSYLRRLANEVMGDGKAVAALALAVGSSDAIVESLLGPGSLVTMGGTMYLAHKAWQAEQQRREERRQPWAHEMYVYYQVRRFG